LEVDSGEVGGIFVLKRLNERHSRLLSDMDIAISIFLNSVSQKNE